MYINIFMFIVSLASMEGVFLFCSRLLRTIDRETGEGSQSFIARAAFVMILIYFIPAAFKVCSSGTGISGCLFWASIALAAYSDICTKEIYDMVYIPAFLAGLTCLGFGFIQGKIPGTVLLQCTLFCALQWILFRRMYGEADCLAFSLCAVYGALLGRFFFDDMILMAVAWLLLALVQICRKNINKKGNLKHPVPMIPYIAVAALLVL